MQVEFSLAGEIAQVIDSIPWVRCASGNVFYLSWTVDVDEVTSRDPLQGSRNV